jgi:hypothetical protein
LTVAGVAIPGFLVMALLWHTALALLIVFAGVLLAIFLRALDRFANECTGQPMGSTGHTGK